MVFDGVSWFELEMVRPHSVSLLRRFYAQVTLFAYGERNRIMVDFQARDTRRDDDQDERESDDTSDATDQQTDTDVEASAQTEDTNESESGFAIVTVATDRTLQADQPGAAVQKAIESAEETVVTRELIQPSYDGIQNTVSTLTEREDVIAVVTVGGTGVEPDDVTVDAVEPLFEKRLPGFGELFRLLAHDDRGTSVIGTRTTAGMVSLIPVFVLPGTTDGALMGTQKIVLHEARPLRDAARAE